MCGRYVLHHNLVRLESLFNGNRTDMSRVAECIERYRYNIKPTQPIPVIVNRAGILSGIRMRWGIIPSGTRSERLTGERGFRRLPPLINARDNRLDQSWPYKMLYSSRRCLIPASGFYEWKRSGKDSKARIPHLIRLADNAPFTFAGLWDLWKDPHGNKVLSCSIVTTSANELVRGIHERMPVILPSDARHSWMESRDLSIGEARELCLPYDPNEMKMYEVSKEVDQLSSEGPNLINPVTHSH